MWISEGGSYQQHTPAPRSLQVYGEWFANANKPGGGRYLLRCSDPRLVKAREAGALEFGVSREPLDRFISGYFYTGRGGYVGLTVDFRSIQRNI